MSIVKISEGKKSLFYHLVLLTGVQEKLGVMNKGVVYALWDYEAQNNDELSFHEGDAITILRRKDDNETEWWWARLNDKEGYVPKNLLGVSSFTSPFYLSPAPEVGTKDGSLVRIPLCTIHSTMKWCKADYPLWPLCCCKQTGGATVRRLVLVVIEQVSIFNIVYASMRLFSPPWLKYRALVECMVALLGSLKPWFRKFFGKVFHT